MSFRSAQLQNFSLYGSGSSIGDTSITLSSFQTIDGVDLALSDFGTAGYMTLEPGSRDREEQISFSGVTQNADGTATLTGVKTVLFLYPYTETSGLTKSHPGGVVAVISNTSGFYNKLTAKDNNETITGYWDVPTPLSSTNVASKGYVDGLVSGGTVTTNALIEIATAGETVTAGQVLYLKTADGRWWKSDGATVATLFNVQLGISQGAGTAGNAITGGVLIRGIDSNQSGITAGALYYVRNGGGLPSSTTGTISRIIGNGAPTSTKLAFDPSMYAATRQAATTTASSVVVTNSSGNIDGTFSKQPTYQKFFASGTWTKPTGLKYIMVEGVGGGGGGGGGENTVNPHVGAGGSGGGYSRKMILAASLGATETVTIGAGGTGGTPPGAAGASTGGTGGTTSFGSHITCLGGGGGVHFQVINTVGSVGVVGVATGGDLNIPGGPGSVGVITASSASAISGKGGDSVLGFGAIPRMGDDSNADGIIGTGAGSGGSGTVKTGTGNNNGGAGTAGFVGVMEFYL